MADSAELAAHAILKLVEELHAQRGMQGRQERFLEEIRDTLINIHRTDEEIRGALSQMEERRRDTDRRIAIIKTSVDDHERRLSALEGSDPQRAS